MIQVGLIFFNMGMGISGLNQGFMQLIGMMNSLVNQFVMGMNIGMNVGMNFGMLVVGNG